MTLGSIALAIALALTAITGGTIAATPAVYIPAPIPLETEFG